jgi:hypothetical protein
MAESKYCRLIPLTPEGGTPIFVNKKTGWSLWLVARGLVKIKNALK